MPKRRAASEEDRGDSSQARKTSRTGLTQLAREEYTVGWICAVPIELGAARALLDETHEIPNRLGDDNNSYTVGKIAGHNVVIAVLPSGEYGTSSAAIVATHMERSFPSVKIRLMVGIAGGAPSSRHDIRLGDVVVSDPRDGHSGVFQYDFGKSVQNQTLHATGFSDQPPRLLRTAVNGLKSIQMNGGGQIADAIEAVFKRQPQLRAKYERPHANTDVLYPSSHTHPFGDDRSCAVVCGESSISATRSKRAGHKHEPVIHYGLIASANQVMKDAIVRDKLAQGKDVLCFEMEAAGLMNAFSCLVIRGICDYSDTHKNKDWQGYAAMAAAMFARDLLSRISTSEPATDVENDRSIISVAHMPEIGSKKTSLSKHEFRALMESLKFEQIDARFLNIKRNHAKTCRWLLRKSEYVDWHDSRKIDQHQGFLWMRGKPGAGKSTLMKFVLLDTNLRNKGDWTVISFFFHARGTELEKTTIGMYRSLLFQLLEQHSALRKVLRSIKGLDWNNPGTRLWTLELLKHLFEQILPFLGRSKIFCFIDALDECEEGQIRDMMGFFRGLGELALLEGAQFRVFFSSRHYPHITFNQGISLVLEGQKGHDKDIARYISKELAIGENTVASQIKNELQEKASGVFMWVALVVSMLNKEHDEGRPPRRLLEKLRSIPEDLHSLFYEILTRDNQKGDDLRLCIQWVLFAKTPLKPGQLYYAILSGIEPEYLSKWVPDEVPIDAIQRFILNSSKGLVEITRSSIPNAQFIHESVRDFLLTKDGLSSIWPHLGYEIQGQSHEDIKRCCLAYISMDAVCQLAIGKPYRRPISAYRKTTIRDFPLLEYAVQNIFYHAEEAQIGGVDQHSFLNTFKRQDWITLHNFFDEIADCQHDLQTSLLYLLAEHGLPALIRAYRSEEFCFKIENERFGTPILAAFALENKKTAVALLEVVSSFYPHNPTLQALINQYSQGIIYRKPLVHKFEFFNYRSTISSAAILGDELILNICLALQTDVAADAEDRCGRTPLSFAAEKGHEGVVQLLLNTGRVNADSKCTTADGLGRTPLSYAAEGGHEKVVQMLLQTGEVNADSKGTVDFTVGRTPLSIAAGNGHTRVVQLLLGTDQVDINSKTTGYNAGRTPLWFAAGNGHEAVVQLLLENAQVDSLDQRGRTPLLQALGNGHSSVARLLVDRGADVDLADHKGQTPKSVASAKGFYALIRSIDEA